MIDNDPSPFDQGINNSLIVIHWIKSISKRLDTGEFAFLFRLSQFANFRRQSFPTNKRGLELVID